MKRLFATLVFILPLLLFAQTKKTVTSETASAKVLAGPMLGYSEHREALIWIQVSCAKKVTLQYHPVGAPAQKAEITEDVKENNCASYSNIKFVPSLLKPGTSYEYQILLDGKPVKFAYNLVFKTKPLWEWRTPAPNFSFIAASCNYVNDTAYDRPGKSYGQGTEIFWRMAETPADFMIWLGDNTYLREADFSSESGIKYRYQHTRGDKNLQKLLATKNHYATWDDHDFGNNNSGKGFPLKQVSYQCFKDYWGNKQFGENNEGVYSVFSYSDADFILLDDRWWRDESDLDEAVNPNKTQLGSKQLEWLFYQLSHSRAPFKFICVGGQFVNEETDKESFNLYKNERQKIIDYIVANKISGVIFLSGDRHHTELLKYNKRETELGYSIFELTSSAISSRPGNVKETSEAENPMRIKSSLVTENNYCRISITGAKGSRQVTFTCYNNTNTALWEFSIDETQLKAKK